MGVAQQLKSLPLCFFLRICTHPQTYKDYRFVIKAGFEDVFMDTSYTGGKITDARLSGCQTARRNLQNTTKEHSSALFS